MFCVGILYLIHITAPVYNTDINNDLWHDYFQFYGFPPSPTSNWFTKLRVFCIPIAVPTLNFLRFLLPALNNLQTPSAFLFVNLLYVLFHSVTYQFPLQSCTADP